MVKRYKVNNFECKICNFWIFLRIFLELLDFDCFFVLYKDLLVLRFCCCYVKWYKVNSYGKCEYNKILSLL